MGMRRLPVSRRHGARDAIPSFLWCTRVFEHVRVLTLAVGVDLGGWGWQGKARQGKAYLTYITDTNISAAIQMCALNDSLEERVGGDGDIYLVRETQRVERSSSCSRARAREAPPAGHP